LGCRHGFEVRGPAGLLQRRTPVLSRQLSCRAPLRSPGTYIDPATSKPGHSCAVKHEVSELFGLLSCRHHPDVGGATEARRFVDIQHAYEVLIGRSRGKEVERGASAGGGWSFHDWCARDGAMCAAAVNTLQETCTRDCRATGPDSTTCAAAASKGQPCKTCHSACYSDTRCGWNTERLVHSLVQY